MSSKARQNWERRLRKLRARVKKLGQNETLLDLTPIDDVEKRTFLSVNLPDYIETMLAMQESFQGDDTKLKALIANLKALQALVNGNLQKTPYQPYKLDKISWKEFKTPRIFVGDRADGLIIDNPLNYPLTDSEETARLVKQGEK